MPVRKSPYVVALSFLLAATTLTLLSVYVPNVIHTVVPTPGPLHFETKYGLYRRCTLKIPEHALLLLEPSSAGDYSLPSSLKNLKAFSSKSFNGNDPWFDQIDSEGDGWQCQPFPTSSECHQFGQGFCTLWSTAGYAAQLSLVPCLISLIVLLMIAAGVGERQTRARRREGGWKIVSGLMSIHAILQILAVGIIIHVYRTDQRFKVGAHLDTASNFGVAAALVSLSMVFALTFTGLAAEAGKPWAGGKSVRRHKHKTHRRTRSGREVPIPPSESDLINERTGLLDGHPETSNVHSALAATGSGRSAEEQV